MIIYLDVDGVVADFFSAALKIHNFDPDKYNESMWNMPQATGMSDEKFWKPIVNNTDFWANLEVLPWADSLMFCCMDFADEVIFLSSSPTFKSSLGKKIWVNKYFPTIKLICESRKEKYAGRGTILIDDNGENVRKFREAGGRSILFPGVGNRLHSVRHKPLAAVLPILYGVGIS